MLNTHNDFNVFLKQEVQTLFRHFSSLFGIRIAFFLPDGTAIERGIHKYSSSYCNCIDTMLNKRDACLKCDSIKRSLAAKTRRRITYHCHAGLVESISPVYLSDNLLGFVMIGQFRDTENISERFLKKISDNKIKSTLQKEFLQLTFMPSDKMKSMLYLFQSLVDFIIASHMIDIKKEVTVRKIIAYIDENIHNPISLSDVARHCCKSNTSITHLFKKQTGRSFKSYVISRKLEKAEELLRTRPELSIAQIAEMLSFSDQFHLSRSFKKYHGFSPSSIFRVCI